MYLNLSLLKVDAQQCSRSERVKVSGLTTFFYPHALRSLRYVKFYARLWCFAIKRNIPYVKSVSAGLLRCVITGTSVQKSPNCDRKRPPHTSGRWITILLSASVCMQIISSSSCHCQRMQPKISVPTPDREFRKENEVISHISIQTDLPQPCGLAFVASEDLQVTHPEIFLWL